MKKEIRIGNKIIGEGYPCFIIAEAGVNHNGKLSLAKKLVDAAKSSGADAVKFQTFKADLIVSKYAKKAQYQRRATDANESQLDMLKKLELSVNDHKELIKYCKARRIIFLSSPFDINSINLLDSLGLETFKVPSGEINNIPYLMELGYLNKKVIISSGMATLTEVREALRVLVSSGTKKDNIVVLHCTSAYPADFKDVNLRAMCTIKNVLKVKVGYSDHTSGIEVSIAAVAIGALVIEKHLTLNKKMPGPDHKASLEPDEFKKMVSAIRNIGMALGTGLKAPAIIEESIMKLMRKSIVAKVDIPKGSRITGSMVDTRRPGTGIEPKYLKNLIGRVASKRISENQVISWGHIKRGNG